MCIWVSLIIQAASKQKLLSAWASGLQQFIQKHCNNNFPILNILFSKTCSDLLGKKTVQKCSHPVCKEICAFSPLKWSCLYQCHVPHRHHFPHYTTKGFFEGFSLPKTSNPIALTCYIAINPSKSLLVAWENGTHARLTEDIDNPSV